MNAYQAGQTLLCGDYDCYTPTGAQRFKKANRWYTTPKVGDVVYFYNSTLKRIGHVGIVTAVNSAKKTFDTIEGNTSNAYFTTNGGTAASHTYSYAVVGGTNRVQGFGRPKFGADTCTEIQFISYALSWKDYEEKKSNGTEAQLQDKHWNPGVNNYTLFGKWYGVQPGQWCQMFVSYCAYMACKQQSDNSKNGWVSLSGNWYYYKDGYAVANTWEYINGRWYAFDAASRMIKGWLDTAEGWYYLGADGGMFSSQWIKYNDEDYYLTSSGLMATNAYIKAEKGNTYYWVNENGQYEAKWDTETPDIYKYEIVK